jgi:hypothetical protein
MKTPKILTKSQQDAIDRLHSALASFTDYYDQAGIGPCHERNDDKDDDDGFNGDERFNVRWGRRALKRAQKAFAFLPDRT